MLEIVLTSSESDQYSSAPKEISKFPLMYMTGYFCRSVYMYVYFYVFSYFHSEHRLCATVPIVKGNREISHFSF